MNKIKITPLGGLGRTGALNCMLYETSQTAVLVDCGAGFVDDTQPGVSIMIPNFDVLESVRDKLSAVLITHGHEDHVGSLPYLLKKYTLPIYATPFARGVIQSKCEEFQIKDIPVHDLSPNEIITIEDLIIEPVIINHSIMDVVALYLKADGFKTFHCTDFKIDDEAPEDKAVDLKKFKAIGKEGLDLLLLDSTNSLQAGCTTSEAEVRENLYNVFDKIKGRLITCLFSSNTYRLQSLLECAKRTGRKVALTGRSTKEYFRIAAALDRLDLSGIDLYDVEDITQFPDDQILVIVTGSQAEPRSVLGRIAKNMFKPLRIQKGDTLLMSSRMIPGNEGRILNMLNQLSMLGVEIITDNSYTPVHVSGHAMVDELKEVIGLLKPKNLIPIHGEYRQLKALAKIAEGEGVPQKGVLVLTDGVQVELSKRGLKVIDELSMEPKFISENLDLFITTDAIKRRRKLAFNGLVIVSLIHDSSQDCLSNISKIYSEGIFWRKRREKGY